MEQALETRYANLLRPNLRKRFAWIGGSVLLITYFIYIWFAFDLSAAFGRASMERVSLLALDTIAYKTHVEISNDDPAPEVLFTLEGDRRNPLSVPDWAETLPNGKTHVEFLTGETAVISKGVLEFTDTEGQVYFITANEDGVVLDGEPQDWMIIADNKIEGRPDILTRFTVTANKTLLQRYQWGWENFWFDARSPLQGYSLWQALGTIGQAPIDPDMSNFSLIFDEIWNNLEWQHGDVFKAMGITVIMAFAGTLMAILTALPLAFLASRNTMASRIVRTITKRGFDILRGVDSLIWSLIFIRAFGLGPLSGIFAIWLTDTGTFGKLFSESIENADPKQYEGMSATGANAIQRNFFGFIPQIAPVFISQAFYMFESNTRSATIIGMLGAGGIGLKLAETMSTSRDWENTAYLIVIIIATVIALDNVSSWIRNRLIQGSHA